MFFKNKKKDIKLKENDIQSENDIIKYTISRDKYLEKYKYPPERSLIYFIDGADKKDAKSKALGLAEEHCTSYNNTFYRIEKFRGGYLVEIQEGNKTSFIHSIIRMVNTDNDVKIYFPSQLNHSYISFKNGRFESAKLDDDSENKLLERNDLFYPLPEGKMKQVFKSGFSYMVFSLVLFFMSTISLSFSGYSYIEYLDAEYSYGQPNINNMPYKQWKRVEDRGGNVNQYSGALRFKNGNWSVDWIKDNDIKDNDKEKKDIENLKEKNNENKIKNLETKDNENKINPSKVNPSKVNNNLNKKPWE